MSLSTGPSPTRAVVEPTPLPSRRARWVRAGGAIVLATAIVWLVSALALVIYTAGARQPRRYELTIPPGSSELIAAGENPLEIPRIWSFLADDTLVIDNRDSVPHVLATWYVPAGETREVILQPIFAGALVCTLHPSGTIDVVVDVRRFDWRLPTIPAVAFGPALAIVVLGTARIMRSLDD